MIISRSMEMKATVFMPTTIASESAPSTHSMACTASPARTCSRIRALTAWHCAYTENKRVIGIGGEHVDEGADAGKDRLSDMCQRRHWTMEVCLSRPKSMCTPGVQIHGELGGK